MANVKRMAEMAEKSLGYGVNVHSNLRAVIILAHTEEAYQQTWGAEISVTHRKIVSKYRYNHVHYTESIRKLLQILATVDAAQDQRKSKALGELADMVSQGMTRLQQLVQQQPEPPPYQSESDKESAHAARPQTSKAQHHEGGNANKKKGDTVAAPPPHPHPDHPPPPPLRQKITTSRRARSRKIRGRGKKKEKKKNMTGCKYCTKYRGNGLAHGPPKNIRHSK